ncbi:UDP-N-acetylmuramate dehydrogenase [Cricetibacter osteomyelitidis]|uniref:UDP-N-acetylenolpyruvoylglucosamine reductase n=1 Tax=Cricetibacter osteomyelitidis TaxID=1521931 RepID=A0A4V6NS89_9PAST|nr:UDP-N-acetylmuramate dehydrogenase [Cricetibacter osteomyelitidis]TCP96283.1 UDP-N-acetylmuramate dehydrogenase [Cricetibacter osteomyelitidis]
MQDLRPFHTFAVPAQAKRIIEIYSIDQLIVVWAENQQTNEPVLFLGQGSNVLFLEDFQGTVLINKLKGINQTDDENFHYLHVNGGENWHELVQWTLKHQIYGLENLALIPGCAGTAPVQNIGAYGVEFKDVCDYVDVLNLNTGEQFRLATKQCKFGYRESVFKHQYNTGYFITAVGLKLAKNWQPTLAYGSLSKFDKSAVTSQEIFNEVCAMRQAKLPDYKQWGNAGSFFKNPTVSKALAGSLLQQYPTMPHFPQADGSVKLAAGWLIDQCGLKGYQIGGAAVHENQALVLINKDNATGQDVVALARHVRKAVGEQFNVWLQPEVRFIAATGEIDSTKAIS